MSKTAFVVMPFVKANGRGQTELTDFFDDYIKRPLERANQGKLKVVRSGNSLLMLDQIILDLAKSDYVICDLSGHQANPNVMFELGVRLSVSQLPTILIREDCVTNERIFDVGGLYTHPYSLTATRKLEDFLVDTIQEYEDGTRLYESPTLKILNHSAAFWMQLPISKACAFLGGISSACEAYLSAFSRAVALHLHKKGILEFHVPTPELCYKSFSVLIGREGLLDEFPFLITSIPSLDSYLSSVYLLGLIEDDIERSFRGYAMDYSIHFNKGNSSAFWPNKFEESVAYSMETLLLMNLSRCVITILRSKIGSEERKELKAKFYAQLKHSQFNKV